MLEAERVESVPVTVVQQIDEIAQRYRDRVAIVALEGTLSYGELLRRADALARRLVAGGVGRDAVVAICLERSLDLVVAVLGVLKAGAAYLPLRPADPAARNALVLEDSGTRHLVSTPDLAAALGFRGATFAATVAERDGAVAPPDGGALPLPAGGDLAYVIYTSGSTGRPKGCAIEHAALENRLRWMQKAYPISCDDVLLQKTVHTFDVSVWELLWWALHGASLVLLPRGQERDPRALARAIARHRVTVAHFVPSMLALFLEYLSMAGARDMQSLRWVFASGEKLMADTVATFYRLFAQPLHAALVNLYGPTEAAIDVTHHCCRRGIAYDDIPIGKPIDQIRCYVLDEALEAVPDGDRGELYLAGIGLARCYYNNPELTARSFFAHPRIAGERLYKTGDIVCRSASSGEIHYFGRSDTQVKLRGLRIELGEIDHHLRACDGVRDALVLADTPPGAAQCILALVRAGREFDAAAAWSGLAAALPEYMLPARLVVLDDLPRLANGKVDRVEARDLARRVTSRTSDLRAGRA